MKSRFTIVLVALYCIIKHTKALSLFRFISGAHGIYGDVLCKEFLMMLSPRTGIRMDYGNGMFAILQSPNLTTFIRESGWSLVGGILELLCVAHLYVYLCHFNHFYYLSLTDQTKNQTLTLSRQKIM